MPTLQDLLLAAGFKPEAHPTLGAGALTKQMKAWDMPYVREHIVGTMGVTDSDLVYVEVVPGGQVQMGIESVGYYEEPVLADSEEGKGILRDAGVAVG